MAVACDISGKIRNNEGEVVDSKLYKDLKKILPASEVDNYYHFINNDLKNNDNYKNLQFDENGEPTITSLLENTNTLRRLISENRASSEILKDLPSKSAANYFSFNSLLKAIIKKNKELAKDNVYSAFRIILLKRYDSFSKKTIIEPSVVKVDNFSSIWDYKLQMLETQLSYLKENEDNRQMSREILDNLVYSMFFNFPERNDEVPAFNENIIYNYIKDIKNSNIKVNSAVDPLKIAAKSPLYERLSSLVLDFDNLNDYDLDTFFKQNNLDIDIDDLKENPTKYSNIILRTLYLKYQTDKNVLNYIKNPAKRESVERLLERISKEVKSMWDKINIPKQKINIKIEDTIFDKYKNEKSELFIDTDKLIKDMGKDYDIMSSTQKAVIALLKKTIEAEANQQYIQKRLDTTNLITDFEKTRRKQTLGILIDLFEMGEYNLALYQYYTELNRRLQMWFIKIENSTDLNIFEKAQLIRQGHVELSMFRQISDYFEKNSNDIVLDINTLRSKITDIFNVIFKKGNKWDLTTGKALNMYKNNPIEFEMQFPEITSLANAYWETFNIDNKTNKFRALNETFIVQTKRLQNIVYDYSKKIVIKVFEANQDEAARVIPFGKDKGKKVDIEELLTYAERDMWGAERLLDSMAESPDIIQRLIDKIVKKYKNKARLESVSLSKEIIKEAALLEQAGIKDTKWMFAKTDNGKTGKYAQFGDKEYYEIMANPAKKRFYEFFMRTKAKLDSKYPPNTIKEGHIINIRKDLMERMKESGNIKDMLDAYKESVKDEWLNKNEQSEDIIGYSQGSYTLEGEEINLLPIYYQNIDFGNQKDLNEISEDAVSTLIAYAGKSYDYQESNKIINILELAKEILKERMIPNEKNGKKIYSEIQGQLSQEEQDAKVPIYHKDNGASNLSKRLQGYYDVVFYAKSRKSDKTIGKFSAIKVVDKLNSWTARAAMSLSALNGISNVTTGSFQMLYESLSKHYFKPSDVAWANATYAKNLVAMMGNLGKRIKDDKLSLFTEMLDISQEYDKQQLNNIDWDKKTKLGRIEFGEAMMFMQNAGEHWMSHKTALSIAHTIMLKDKNGKLHNLWDSLEIEYIQENGSYGKKNKHLGARLKIKDGYTKEDGSKFTENDIIKIQQKIAAINHGMHGIYNKIDSNMIQMTALGRAAYLFRKWMWSSYYKRLHSMNYDYDIKEWDEGYYRSCCRFIVSLAKDIKQARFDIKLHWNELSKTEQNNCKKALAEVGAILAIIMTNALIDWDDDDDEDNWAKNMTEYQLIRLQSELSSLNPVGLVHESIRLLKSPMPAITTLDNILDTFKALWIPNWFEEETKGMFKGHSEGFRYLFGNKVLNPYYQVMWRNLNADTQMQWYLQ